MKRHSTGKKFHRIKGIKKADLNAIISETPKQIEEFIESLSSQGSLIKKVKYAYFQTKNGLKFPGFIATEPIVPNDTLVTLPRETLLTTLQAFESPLKPMFLEYPQFFSPQFHSQWEYHQILAFLLYEYQRGTDSKWYYMIVNFPRDVDYAVFWNTQELESLKDENIIKSARKKYIGLLVTFQTLRYIADKFPNLYKPGIVTMENAIWIHTSIVTRCFGGQGLKYVTMVPFCELFNHECADVCYDLEQQDQSTRYNYEFMTKKLVQGQENDDELSITSSENSQFSEDDMSDSEFVTGEYDQYQEFNFDKFSENSIINFEENIKSFFKKNQSVKSDELIKMRKEFNIRLNIQQDVFQLAIDCKAYLFQTIDFGDNFSIFFLGQIFQQLDQLIQQFFSLERSSYQARAEIQQIKIDCNLYKNFWYSFQNEVLKRPIQQKYNVFAQKIVRKPERPIFSMEQILSQPVDRSCDYYTQAFQKETFKNLLMRTRDPFEKGAQVYFCYSRLSNRIMLLKYGMSLEYNKYDSTFLRVEFLKYIKNKVGIWIVHRFKLNKLKRFKLKHIVPPYELIVFCKLIYWNTNVHSVNTIFNIQDLQLERQALSLALEILIEQNSKFKETIEELEQLLLEKSLGYHQYFAVIYRLERLRIYRRNIHLINISIIVIDKLMKGVPYEKAIERTEFDLDFYETNRYILRKYFDQIRGALYQQK
ncbi:unnamed protein product (macronuclear) [Paramecium tetraurelia]|uniref:SET domain-containing protein n=1 Tax=Paramecium tetraurelia TaxID=5888 RepID=A0C4J5_PARTE|nr:uncharacterized protein GSPATT00035192001 [Paramecium tetraurelia]CAK65712.1 unnamed protein product [Paramecium tetraurelia]|eukprot:XP_001433109.1 hypothetical protein (macronuclear) [Paramecium tetraurelia strain d4-2]